MEAFGLLLTYTNLDLSQYAMEILPSILSQARHNDEARRKESLQLVTQLVLHTSDLDAVSAMFQAVKSIIAGTLHALLFSIVLGYTFSAWERHHVETMDYNCIQSSVERSWGAIWG